MSKATEPSLSSTEDSKIKDSNKRYYWLGHDGESAQDRFFIEALDSNLWIRGDAKHWDTCWYTGMPDADTFEQLDAEKTINHIPGNNALTIKSHLYETLMDAKHHALDGDNASRYQFFPDTYSMPEDYYRYQADAAAEPDTLWIQKPKNLSRGRGIEVVQHPATVPFESDWLMQRYIKEPHLYEGHKYVLRFYVLITSVEPLRFYLYEEGFAKLASETYDENELDNLYRHLTNPDVNEENDNVDVPVTFFSFARYREWLKSCGHDDEKLFNEFKDLIALTVIAAREKMRHQLDAKQADTRGCYELIGLDCMVDKNIKPWILECNLSPSLETYASGDSEASDEFTVKRQLVHDLVDMMQLNAPVQDYSPETRARIENKNRGGFIPLLTQDNANQYLPCFPIPRASDVLALGDTAINYKLINTQVNESKEVVFDDSLAIQTTDAKGQVNFLSPNELATWIWIKNSEGLTPPQIAQVLIESMPIPQGSDQQAFAHTLLTQVWNTLADWGQAGAFDKRTHTDQAKDMIASWQEAQFLQLDDDILPINLACPVAANYLKPLLEKIKPELGKLHDTEISIYPGQYGYTLMLGNKIVEEKVTLAELMPTVLNTYFTYISQYQHFTAKVITVKKHTVLMVAENPLEYLGLLDSSDANMQSCFPALGDTACEIEIRPLPLIKAAATTTVGDKSIIARAAKTTHLLEKNTVNNQSLLLDGIIFAEKSEEQATMNNITQAKALTLLWPCFFKKDASTATALSQWLSDIPLAQYNVSSGIDFMDVVNQILLPHKKVDRA